LGGTIQSVWGGTIQYVRGGTIQYVRGGTIQSVWGGTIQSVWGGTIQSVRGGTIQSVWGGTIQYVWGGTIQSVWGGTIQYVWGNATIHVYSKTSFTRITQQTTIIVYSDGEIDAEYVAESVAVVHRTTKIQNTLSTTREAFGLVEDENGNLTLFKARNPETKCDYRTGKIKYEGEVVCPDWGRGPNRQCGGDLHISPLPGLTRIYSPDGEIVEVKVRPEDIVVHSDDITKCRARRVVVGKVVEEGRVS
jgi:hypothetical protein